MNAKRLINISRPRFWLYTFGTYVVGVFLAVTEYSEALDTMVILFGVFFLFPANILLYGINDIFDYETDKLNPKKIEYEELVSPKDRRPLWRTIILALLPFLYFITELEIAAFWAMIAYLVTAVFYSTPPVRAKAKPVLDMTISASTYISAGVAGYLIAGGEELSWLGIFGAILWAMAMHVYSAVPDIPADKEAGVATTATLIGARPALIFCLLAYLASAIIGGFFLWLPVTIVLGIVYVVMMLLTLVHQKKAFTYYKYFPLINMISGMVIFFSVVLK